MYLWLVVTPPIEWSEYSFPPINNAYIVAALANRFLNSSIGRTRRESDSCLVTSTSKASRTVVVSDFVCQECRRRWIYEELKTNDGVAHNLDHHSLEISSWMIYKQVVGCVAARRDVADASMPTLHPTCISHTQVSSVACNLWFGTTERQPTLGAITGWDNEGMKCGLCVERLATWESCVYLLCI